MTKKKSTKESQHFRFPKKVHIETDPKKCYDNSPNHFCLFPLVSEIIELNINEQ